jgi:hypothetical protein
LTSCDCSIESHAGYNGLTPESAQKYGGFLWCLIFNLVRQKRKLHGAYDYPLTLEQDAYLTDLSQLAKNKRSATKLRPAIHKLLLSLFSHRHAGAPTSPFFTAVICFAVLSAYTEAGNLKVSTSITSQLMMLVYAGRSVAMTEMHEILAWEPNLTVDEYVKICLWVTVVDLLQGFRTGAGLAPRPAAGRYVLAI